MPLGAVVGHQLASGPIGTSAYFTACRQSSVGLRLVALPRSPSWSSRRQSWSSSRRHSSSSKPQQRVYASSNGRDDDSSGGGDGGGSSVVPLELRQQLQLLGTLIVRYPAIIGSIAVAAGYVLHLDALGNLHWNSHDALLGVQCSLPILVLDAVLMLPDYSPGTAEKTIKMKVPRSVAEKLRQQDRKEQQGSNGAAAAPGSGSSSSTSSSQEQQAPMNGIITSVTDASDAGSSRSSSSTGSSTGSSSVPGAEAAQQKTDAGASTTTGAAAGEAGAEAPAAAPAAAATAAATTSNGTDEELVEVERTISVRADQHPVLAALYRIQLEKAMDNVGRYLWFPLELVLLLTWHLAEEMLYRAIVLGWAAGWTIDRLYEGGVDDTVSLLGLQLATPQAGAVLAAVGCTTVSLALLVQRNLFPVKLLAKAEEELEASKDSGLVKSEKDRSRMKKVLSKVKSGLVRQRQWTTAVEGVREVTEWASYSTAYLLTGNLLAPYLTAVSSDLLFSLYQRYKQRQVDAAQRQTLQQIRELQKTALAIKDAKMAALQPPPVQQQQTPAASAAKSHSEGEGEGESEGGSNSSSGGGNGAAEVPAQENSNGTAASSSSSSSSEGSDAATPAGMGSGKQEE